MMYIVVTGRAYSNGRFIERDHLTQMCNIRGIVIESKISRNTQFLVASRKDTMKAQEARYENVPVLTYDQFFAMLVRTKLLGR
jgi:NAD-dependent DNA ligase